MKLYTEEQVRYIINRARLHNQDDTEMFTNEYLLSQETPIELPSDEEIFNATPHYDGTEYSTGEHHGFIKGAQWLRDKILNK